MPARPWPRALLIALLAVYLPTCVPFAFGPLTDCDHCVTNYLQLLPIVPGIAGASLATTAGDVAALAVAAACTLALLAAAVAIARRLPPRDLTAAFAILVPLLGLESYTFALMLRA